jgi:hypothetical protein
MNGISANNNISMRGNNNTPKLDPDKAFVNYVIDKAIEENTLARTPEQDTFVAGANVKGCFAPPKKIAVQDVTAGLGIATSVLIALKQLAQAGFDVWDTFVDRFGKPKSAEEEKALKAFLAPNPNANREI